MSGLWHASAQQHGGTRPPQQFQLYRLCWPADGLCACTQQQAQPAAVHAVCTAPACLPVMCQAAGWSLQQEQPARPQAHLGAG